MASSSDDGKVCAFMRWREGVSSPDDVNMCALIIRWREGVCLHHMKQNTSLYNFSLSHDGLYSSDSVRRSYTVQDDQPKQNSAILKVEAARCSEKLSQSWHIPVPCIVPHIIMTRKTWYSPCFNVTSRCSARCMGARSPTINKDLKYRTVKGV